MVDDTKEPSPVNMEGGGPHNPLNVAPIIAPDADAMLEHLTMLFGRAQTGRIEITAIHTDKTQRRSPRTKFFAPDALEEAATFADKTNREPGWNVYVGAALRSEEVFPGQAADDTDFLEVYAVWADADDGDQMRAARQTYRDLLITPGMVVVTGQVPSTRAQLWWPLENPIRDIDILRSTVRGISSRLGTDTRVCTGKQLMRLAGGVNWPKKEDRVLERTHIIIPQNANREFMIEQVHRAFPPIETLPAGVSTEVAVTPAGSLGLGEVVEDGREGFAFRWVRAVLREFIGTTGTEPTPTDLFEAIAPAYFKRVSQARPGRGVEFLKQKCVEAVRAFHEGKIPGAETLDRAVENWAARHPQPSAKDTPPDEDDDEEQDGPFRASDLHGEPPERQWVVRDWVVEGAVNSLYGDGGLGKTLIAQQLAYSVSQGSPWLGLETKRGTVMAVLCEDDRGELHRRHNQIKTAMGFPVGNPFDEVWLWPRVGDDNVLVRWNSDSEPMPGPFSERLIKAIETNAPSLLVLDTLADFYGGNEIDRVQVNYFVKTVLGGLIKRRASVGHPLTVLLLGHPSVAGKGDGRGFSGSTAWNNSVRSRIYLTRPEEGSNDERLITRGKANYAASGDETSIRLIYSEGVFHAETDVSDDNSLLWAACQKVAELVGQAYRGERPFNAKKGHPRFIYTALPVEMAREGFAPELCRQAIRTSIDDGGVTLSAGGKRGYKAT